MARFHFRCSECGAQYREDEVRYVCPRCARLQEPGRELRGILEVEIEELPRSWLEGELASPAFLKAFLPIVDELVTEGMVTLEAVRVLKYVAAPATQ